MLSYNHGRYLRSAIDSVLGQDFPDFELLILDDASTDDSFDILRSYDRLDDPRVQVFVRSRNIGITRSLNEGVRLCRGEYVVPVASDDIMAEGRLRFQIEEFGQLDHQVGMLCGDARLIDTDGRPLFSRDGKAMVLTSEWMSATTSQTERLLVRCGIAAPTVMLRSSVYEAVGLYNETLEVEDWEFWIRVSRAFEIAYRPRVVTHYRTHATQTSRNRLWMRRQEHASLSAAALLDWEQPRRSILEARLARAAADLRWAEAVDGEQCPTDSRRAFLQVVAGKDQRLGQRVRAVAGVVAPQLRSSRIIRGQI